MFVGLFVMKILVKVGFERVVKVGFNFCIVVLGLFCVIDGCGLMWIVKFWVVVGIVKVVFCCVWLKVFLLFFVLLNMYKVFLRLVWICIRNEIG